MKKLLIAGTDGAERRLDAVFTFGLAPKKGRSLDERLSRKTPAGGFLTFAACAAALIAAALIPSDAASVVLILSVIPPVLIFRLLSVLRAAALRRRVIGFPAAHGAGAVGGGDDMRSA